MEPLPAKISDAYERLKMEYRFSISLKKINNKYYLYRQTTVTDKSTKKQHVIMNYLGRILESGTFIPKANSQKAQVEYAKALIEAQGGKVLLPKEAEPFNEIETASDMIDKKILIKLSMDVRGNHTSIANEVGLSESSIGNRIKKLEERYGIKRTIEVYPERFGFTRYIVTIKFLNRKPDYGLLKPVLEDEPRVQAALSMSGDYDLLLYIISETTSKLEDIVYKFRSDLLFSDIQSVWNIGYIIEGYGYIPLRDKFFELLKDRVWKRTKESPRRKPDQLFPSEFAVLKELNKDAGVNFSEIDERNKLRRGSAQYAYHKLLNAKLIERATITMQKAPIKYCGLLYVKQVDIVAFNKTRISHLGNIIEEIDMPLNKYIFYGDVSAPNGAIFLMPIYQGTSIESAKKDLEEKVKGIQIESAVITDYLVGYLGFRLFDNKESVQYRIINKLAPNEKAI